jgi:hypothetical protein
MRRSRRQMGWDPREPGFLALGLFLVFAAGFFPLWGVVEDISEIPYHSSAGTDLGLWMAGTWQLQILPGTAYRRSSSFFFWEFAEDHPEFGGYSAAAPGASALWALALVAGGRAFFVRFRPRSRGRGIPTIFEAVAATSGGVALAVVAIGFPAGSDYSFVGAEGRFAWGPGVGWYIVLVGVVLMSLSTALGWLADRSLKGRCWKCYRETNTPVCGYCGADR